MANNNKYTGPNVPALRFPEFSGEWETKTMLEIAPLQRGFDLPKGNIQPGDIPVVYSNGIMSTHNQSKCIGPGVITGRSGTIGSFTFIPNGPYWPHNTALWVTNFCGNVPLFIYHLYSHIGIVRFASGSGVPTLNRNDVHKHITSIPSNLREQNKIASFLSLLDDRIEIQSKIIEEQETLLRSLRHKLLNQCLDSHTQCRIGDILSIGSGKDYQHLREGEIPVYGTGGLISHVNESLYDGESVCIGRKGTINKPLYLSGRFWTVDTLFYTHSFNGILPRFCYHLFCTIDWLTYNEASGVPSLSKSTIEKIIVSIPQIDIQKRIVQILDSIEEKINIDRNTLLDYQKQKIYLLSRMFI